MNTTSLTKLVILTFICLFNLSCKQEEVKRHYEEIVITPSSTQAELTSAASADPHGMLKGGPSMSQVPDVVTGSVTQPELSWKTPSQWNELPGTGMRLAAFTSKDESHPIDCSIIALSGSAGGIKANVGRWMHQLDIPIPTQEEMDKFINKLPVIKTKDGHPGTLVDLSALQSKHDGPNDSMIGAVLELKDMSIFIKMTGTRASVIQNKSAFDALIKSLTVENK